MKSPKPPDPYKTAAAQQKAEVGAAGASSVMNNPNVVTPYGSQSYSISGWEQVPDATGKLISVPRYTQTQTLSPDQQRLMNLQTQMSYNTGQTGVEQSAKLRSHLNQSINTAGWQGWNAGPQAAKLATTFGGNDPMAKTVNLQKTLKGENIRQDAGPTDRAAIERAMMQNYTEDTSGQQRAQDAQMAARGLNPGSSQYGGIQKVRGDERARAGRESYLASGGESRAAQDAYNQAAMQRFQQTGAQGEFANAAALNAANFQNTAQQQAYQQAMQRAGFSNEALTSMYNMGGQTADRANALRGLQASEAFALRNQPINEIAALQGGSQVTMPQFSPYQGQGINSANIGQYIGNNYAQQNAAAGNFNSGLFNMAGAIGGAALMSERSMKKDIKPINARLAGVPLYTFRYRFDPGKIQVGVMADEAKILHPDAVISIDGIDHVRYDLLAERNKGETP